MKVNQACTRRAILATSRSWVSPRAGRSAVAAAEACPSCSTRLNLVRAPCSLLTGAVLAPWQTKPRSLQRCVFLGASRKSTFPDAHRGPRSRAVSCRLARSQVAAAPAGRQLARRRCHLGAIGLDDTIERRWGRTSAPRASIVTRSAPPRGTSSKPSGLRWLSVRLLGPSFHGLGRVTGPALSHRCLRRPNASMPRHAERAPKTLPDWARPGGPADSTARCRVAPHRHRRRHRQLAAIRFLAAVPEPLSQSSMSSPDYASTPIFMPPHRPDADAADDRRSREATPGQIRPGAARPPYHLASPHRHPSCMAAPIAASSNSIPAPPSGCHWPCLAADPMSCCVLSIHLANSSRRSFPLFPDLDAGPVDILQRSVSRWQASGHLPGSCPRHLGVETQRQSSDLADFAHHPSVASACSRCVTLLAQSAHLRRLYRRVRSRYSAAWIPKSHAPFPAMPSPPCVERNLASSEFLHVPECLADVIKISPPITGNARQTHSPMPRNSIKSS